MLIKAQQTLERRKDAFGAQVDLGDRTPLIAEGSPSPKQNMPAHTVYGRENKPPAMALNRLRRGSSVIASQHTPRVELDIRLHAEALIRGLFRLLWDPS